MDRLRHLLLLRLGVFSLLAGLALGLVAPVASAAERTTAQERARDLIPTELLNAALDAAERGTQADRTEALIAALGEDLPAVETLLEALYGHLLRALQLEFGTRAVLMTASSSSSSASSPTSHAAVFLSPERGTTHAFTHTVRAVAGQESFLPRMLRPAVQPLGP
ncbi:MAG: hypothetical protein HKN04_13325 [Rhodothermaceae bacterium]|nr:hypothetical protein [Rhodothermaceae bacterium]